MPASTLLSRRIITPVVLVLGVALAALASGCAPSLTADSSLTNLSDSAEMWPLNNSPPGSPTAIDFFSGNTVRADQAFAYDIAFDLDSANGTITVIPVARVATTLSSTHRVGLQIISQTYGDLTSAPRSGYSYDSTFNVQPGTVMAIESDNTVDCSTSITGTSYYAKIQVYNPDFIHRTLMVAFTADRNCGFRSLAPLGVPQF